MTDKPKGKGGRRTGFQHEWIAIAKDLAATGHSNMEIYASLNVSRAAFSRYLKNNRELREVIKEARKKPYRTIEAALYRRAKGFKIRLKRMVMVTVTYKNGTTKQVPKILDTEEYFPPNPTSMIFFLKNRFGERWRDIWHGEIASPEGKNLRILFDRGSLDPTKLPNEEGKEGKK